MKLITYMNSSITEGEQRGRPVRAYVDTGNCALTDVAARAARRLPSDDRSPRGFGRLKTLFAPEVSELRGLHLAGVDLPDWPVSVTPRGRREIGLGMDVLFRVDFLHR